MRTSESSIPPALIHRSCSFVADFPVTVSSISRQKQRAQAPCRRKSHASPRRARPPPPVNPTTRTPQRGVRRCRKSHASPRRARPPQPVNPTARTPRRGVRHGRKSHASPRRARPPLARQSHRTHASERRATGKAPWIRSASQNQNASIQVHRESDLDEFPVGFTERTSESGFNRLEGSEKKQRHDGLGSNLDSGSRVCYDDLLASGGCWLGSSPCRRSHRS